MKITHYFFSNNIGIVHTEDEYEGPNFFMKSVSGFDIESDIKDVAAWGSRFPTVAGSALLTNGYMTKCDIKL